METAIGWILVGGMACAIAVLIYQFLSPDEALKEQEEKERAEAEARAKVEAEAEELRNRLEAQKNAYSIEFDPIPSFDEQKVKVIPHLNREVCACYQQYHKTIWEQDLRISELERKNAEILACPGCSTDEESLAYIQSNADALARNKQQALELITERDRIGIQVTDFEYEPLTRLRNAITFLAESEKCLSDSELEIEDFVKDEIPAALACFRYSVKPVVLNFETVTACCFPKFILLYKDGKFLTALYPSAMEIDVTRIETTASYSFTSYGFACRGYSTREPVSDDSELISTGRTRVTWQHTRKDGSPDLRYKDNPSSRYRTDKLAYGNVRISLNEHIAEFGFSSQKAREALGKASDAYCVKNKPALDPVPLLLDLLAAAGADSGDVAALKKRHVDEGKSMAALCTIVGTGNDDEQPSC